MPPDEDASQPKKRKVVGFRAPEREHAAVALLAEHRGTTMSELMRSHPWNELVKEGERLAERLDRVLKPSA